MGDKRLSEAVRARMFYIITGERLPMSTVAGWHRVENGDGTYTVQSTAADGEYPTSIQPGIGQGRTLLSAEGVVPRCAR